MMKHNQAPLKSRKYIACQIYKPYLERILKEEKLCDEVEYVDIEVHNEPQKLRETLQERIDANQDKDEIVLLYGICGNAAEGLRSEKSELILFRVHDCLAVLLGSNKRYQEMIEVHKTGQWKCEGNYSVYLQRYGRQYYEYVRQYGEDNARYIMSVLNPESDRTSYICFGTEEDRENIRRLRQTKKVTVWEGDMQLLRDMMLRRTNDMILHVKAGGSIHCIYDYETVMQERRDPAMVKSTDRV